MRRSIYLISCVCTALWLGGAGAAGSAPLGTGDPAPDFTLSGDGKTSIRLSQFAGKKDIVLLFSRAHW